MVRLPVAVSDIFPRMGEVYWQSTTPKRITYIKFI